MKEFDVGTLVHARGRDWVILPQYKKRKDILYLRPVNGTEVGAVGIYVGLNIRGEPFEKANSTQFRLPDPKQDDMGNHLSCELLRNAARLGFRSGAGPFRSLARIAVEPRPYQMVPLLMALRLDPVRLMIADDVGIGKTIEACLIARELFDRGEIERFSVLCPPHLAEQWEEALEIQFQFKIKPTLVLSSTARRLEKTCLSGETIFDKYPITVISTDYIKQEKHRNDFLRAAPELLIVDEAHTCASSSEKSITQKRHKLLQALINSDRKSAKERHLILVTATPHSGNDNAFRSLLSLLNPDFLDLPEDLSGDKNRKHREKLAEHFVQRRRGDLKAYLDTVTPFPDRNSIEAYYTLSNSYRNFMDKILGYCRELVRDESGKAHHKRVRWWSALALLRSISSSPAAATSTLKNRSITTGSDDPEEIDEIGRRAVLDQDDENYEGIDVVPGSISDEKDETSKRLLRYAREAEKLKGRKHDKKLDGLIKLIQKQLKEGYSTLVFCRFIPTVEYVTDELRKVFPPQKGKVQISQITGGIPPEERERRVTKAAKFAKRVLVSTDCLSEGTNLQHAFDSVIHYDLSWNPTRHEQREGRVDRYGQKRDVVKTITYYGNDNPVDGIVLEVLLKKHLSIRKQLGITVPIPRNSRVIEDAILEGLLLRDRPERPAQLHLDVLEPVYQELNKQWDASAQREKRSRTLFAQNKLLKAVNEDVRKELIEIKEAIGGELDVKRFMIQALKMMGATIKGEEVIEVDFENTSRFLRETIRKEYVEKGSLQLAFDARPRKDVINLTRTHSLVSDLAARVLESALDDVQDGVGRRCGVIRTNKVAKRTSLLLLRLRFTIVNKERGGKMRPILVEDLMLVGFEGSPRKPKWLSKTEIEEVLRAAPDQNIGSEQAVRTIERILGRFDMLQPVLDGFAQEQGDYLLHAHHRVRKSTKLGVQSLKVNVYKPVDVLGIYVYLPM